MKNEKEITTNCGKLPKNKMKLKTLKDFESHEKEEFYWACEESGGSFEPIGKYISIDELKAEAIKWVKYYQKEGEFKRAFALMDFFNLTEEDLK